MLELFIGSYSATSLRMTDEHSLLNPGSIIELKTEWLNPNKHILIPIFGYKVNSVVRAGFGTDFCSKDYVQSALDQPLNKIISN